MTQKAARPLTRRLVQFLPNAPQSLLYGSAPILCDGTQAGCTFAGSVGVAFGATVGIGRVELAARVAPDVLRSHQLDIEVHDRPVAAGRSPSAREDPRSERVDR